ncbi:MAG TPA: DUF6285 domain-containing protein [Nocardioidaceae bacterium]
MTVPYDEPRAGALVEAVREFLERDVLDATEGSVRFHVRVAVNALRIVERELAHAPVHAEEHHRRLHELGCGDDTELADLVRSHGPEVDRSDLRAALTAMVRAKLTVANPGYLGEAP